MDFIHKYIPSSNGSKATLVLLHGTGGNEEDLLTLGRFLAPNAALLGVRGKVVEGGMSRYFRRLAEGVFDEDDLIFRTHELARFLEEAVDHYHLNPDCLTAVGYSNGANIAASLFLLEPTILSSAILFRAMVPLTPDEVPDLHGRRILLEAGRADPLIPAANTESLGKLLSDAGAQVTVEWQNAGHGLMNPELQSAANWAKGNVPE